MDFRHCLFPFCFIDHIVVNCVGLLTKSPRFTFAHTEIGGGAFSAFSVEGTKIWCVSASSISSCVFERLCRSAESFIQLMQRDPHERDAGCLQFTKQRPGVFVYNPHLLPHALLTLDSGSPTVLSEWDAATTTNQKIIFIQWLSILLLRFVLNGANFFR